MEYTRWNSRWIVVPVKQPRMEREGGRETKRWGETVKKDMIYENSGAIQNKDRGISGTKS